MSLVIRALAETDSLTELTKLLHAAYAPLGQRGFNYTAVDQTEDVTRSRIARGECYVARDENLLVGTILFRRQSRGHPWYEQPHVSTVGQFAVLPAFQRRGIGNKLMALAESRAVTAGATEIALDTSEGADHLIGWYGRLGYRPVGHAQWTGKTYRSVILSKSLTSHAA
ncbi:MAG: GNAT family N-acetyltransferase [Rhodospirillaceae bacterium]